MKKTALIYNFAQHYRTAIFSLLDQKLIIDFYFGDKMQDVKKMDYTVLKNFKNELKNIKIWSVFYWQKGAIKLFFKNYSNYIVLGEYFCLSTWILLILCKFSNKKIYLWTHGWYGNETFLKKIVKKIFFSTADGLFLYGNYAKKLMIIEGFDSNKLHVINNSLDYEKQLEIRKNIVETNLFTNYFSNTFPTLIFIGRLTKTKKLEQLINVFQKLNKKNIFVNLVFVGKGNFETELKQILKNGDNQNYWFYGECYDEKKIAELIYNATLCVSPGNVGLTAMHALVYGTPVITNDDFKSQMPEFEAIQKQKTGDFFIKNNELDLLKTIENWLEKQKDRTQVRENCFKIIDSKYNPNFQFQVINKVLKNNEKYN